MPEFSYKARDDRGSSQTGVIEARTRAEAMASLRQQGYTVTGLTIATQMVDTDAVLNAQAARRVKRDDVVAFANQLAVMIDTGVPLADAINAYTEQASGGPLGRIAKMLDDRISAGVQFSAALAEHPRVFPAHDGQPRPRLRGVGHHGRHARTRRRLPGQRTAHQTQGPRRAHVPLHHAHHGRRRHRLPHRVGPPRFASIYEGRDAALPRPTQFLLGLSEVVSSNLPLLFLALATCVALAVAAKTTEAGRRVVDKVLLGSPVVGPIFRNFHLTRIARTLSTLLAAGIQLKEALEIVRDLTASPQWEALIKDMDETIDAGRTVSDAVLASPLIQSSFGHMIAAGERSGQLEKALERVADVSEEQFEDSVSTGTQLIEPAMIVLMGAVIGSVAVALLLPIFTMGKTMAS